MKISLLLFLSLTTVFTITLSKKEDRIQVAWYCEDFEKAKEDFESNYYCWFSLDIMNNRFNIKFMSEKLFKNL